MEKPERKKILVICVENCFDLMGEKIVLVIENNFCKFMAEGWEVAKCLTSLNNVFKQSQVRTIFETEYIFNFSMEVSQIKCIETIKIQIGKKILGFRNLKKKYVPWPLAEVHYIFKK